MTQLNNHQIVKENEKSITFKASTNDDEEEESENEDLDLTLRNSWSPSSLRRSRKEKKSHLREESSSFKKNKYFKNYFVKEASSFSHSTIFNLCGRGGHISDNCPLRKSPHVLRNFKLFWIPKGRKNNPIGPKKIWVPKVNLFCRDPCKKEDMLTLERMHW